MPPPAFPETPDGTPARSDSERLIDSAEIAALVLDRRLRIQCVTPHVGAHVPVGPADVGRPLADISSTFAPLVEAAEAVRDTLAMIEREVEGANGRWSLAQVRPSRAPDGRLDGVVITFVDLTDRKRREAALAEREERYRLLVEGAREHAMLMTDPEGRLTSWSPGAERVFGYPEAEVVGQPAHLIFTEADRAAGIPEREMEAALREGEAADKRWHLRRDGSLFWGSGFLTTLYDMEGRHRGFAKVLQDATPQKEAEMALAALNATLEDRVRERTRQVQALSAHLVAAEATVRKQLAYVLHDDLQQRLFGLSITLSLLRGLGGLPEAGQTYVAQAIEGLGAAMDLTRTLAADLDPPALASDDLGDVLRWLAEQKRAHHLAVRVEVEEPCPVPDPDLRAVLYQVLREVLFNVVKHAGVDRATLRAWRTPDAVVVRVEDEGVGFDVARLQAGEGVGFGLASVRERLMLAGGRLDVDSAPGRGTRTTLTLPLGPAVGVTDEG